MLNWYNTIFDDGVLSRKLVWQQTIGSVKITLTHVGFATFFKLLPSFLDNKDIRGSLNKYTLYGFSPIIIFKGFHWATLVSLFKTRFINLHGGSITRRHKFSLTEYRLSQFLQFFQIYNIGRTELYESHVDNLFSSGAFQLNDNSSKFIKQLYKLNEYLCLSDYDVLVSRTINSLDDELKNIKQKFNNLPPEIGDKEKNKLLEDKNNELNKLNLEKEDLVESIKLNLKRSIYLDDILDIKDYSYLTKIRYKYNKKEWPMSFSKGYNKHISEFYNQKKRISFYSL